MPAVRQLQHFRRSDSGHAKGLALATSSGCLHAVLTGRSPSGDGRASAAADMENAEETASSSIACDPGALPARRSMLSGEIFIVLPDAMTLLGNPAGRGKHVLGGLRRPNKQTAATLAGSGNDLNPDQRRGDVSVQREPDRAAKASLNMHAA